MRVRHPNRPNATKDKKKRACQMCKNHKRGWTNNFKDKERDSRGRASIIDMVE